MSVSATYISWDPGGSTAQKTTGMASWGAHGELISVTSLDEEGFDREITRIPETVTTFVIEKYVPFGHINHTGNKLTTAQRIGDIKGYARRHKIEIVEQPSGILTVAAMWSQYKIPRNNKGDKKHIPDDLSAYLHGYYYLFNKGLIRPKVLDS